MSGSSDIEASRRTLVPFNKKAISTVNGATNGTTVISLHIPGIGEYGLGEADDFWNNAEILILTGDMKDQMRKVTDWVRATGTLTVDHRFVNPNVSLLTGNVIATAIIIPVVDASVFSVGGAYIWDAVNAETVTIATVDTTLNQLTLLAGLTNPYTVVAGAAISMSPRILAATQFVIMTSTKTEDTGLHTNPARWLHQYHWESGEVTIAAAGAGGQQNLGAVVATGATRRIREITIRHAGTNNTVVTLLIAAGATRLTIDVPAQTTRVWSSEDGRVFLATVQSAVQTSDVTGGSTFVSASGVETVI